MLLSLQSQRQRKELFLILKKVELSKAISTLICSLEHPFDLKMLNTSWLRLLTLQIAKPLPSQSIAWVPLILICSFKFWQLMLRVFQAPLMLGIPASALSKAKGAKPVGSNSLREDPFRAKQKTVSILDRMAVISPDWHFLGMSMMPWNSKRRLFYLTEQEQARLQQAWTMRDLEMEEFAYSFLANSKEICREGSRLMSRWLISFHSPSRAYCLVRISKVPSTKRMGSDLLRVYFFINIIFSALQSRLIFNYITE